MQRVSDLQFVLAESPRYLNGSVFFTDIDEKKFYCYSGSEVKMVWDKEQITSFAFDVSGGMVFATMHGLYRMRQDGSYYALAEGLKINDMGVDPKGRIIFGTNYHVSGRKFKFGSLYAYDAETGLQELDYGYHLSNGVGFSPDGKTMYVSDSMAHMIYSYDYDPETLTCGRREVFVRFPLEDGLPDGMTIDEEGNILTAQWGASCVIRTAPDGTEIERIPVPIKNVSAVEYTPNGLFITSAKGMNNGKEQYGGVFVTDTAFRGQPHKMANIPVNPNAK